MAHEIDYNPLMVITIPAPMYKARARGRQARFGDLSAELKIHFSADDATLIRQEADRAGITFSAFVRWAAAHAAAACKEHYDHVPRPKVDP